jgi:hypothetical protein
MHPARSWMLNPSADSAHKRQTAAMVRAIDCDKWWNVLNGWFDKLTTSGFGVL